MRAFGKVSCQGGGWSDKWPLKRVYDGIPQTLAGGKHRRIARSRSPARSYSADLAFRRRHLPIRSILLTLAGTLNSFRREVPPQTPPVGESGGRSTLQWILKPPLSVQKARKSRVGIIARDFVNLARPRAFGITLLHPPPLPARRSASVCVHSR